MEQQSYQNIWSLLTYVAVVASAAALLLAWFVYLVYQMLKDLHRFTSETETAVQQYLATHHIWSDVAHKAFEVAPAVFEGGIRFASGLMELAETIHRAGGAAKLVDKVLNQQKDRKNGRTTNPRSGAELASTNGHQTELEEFEEVKPRRSRQPRLRPVDNTEKES